MKTCGLSHHNAEALITHEENHVFFKSMKTNKTAFWNAVDILSKQKAMTRQQRKINRMAVGNKELKTLVHLKLLLLLSQGILSWLINQPLNPQ